MAVENLIEEVQQKATQEQDMPQLQSNIQEDIIGCKPAHWEDGIHNLVTAPDGEPIYDENGYVTWVAPSYAEETKKDDPKFS